MKVKYINSATVVIESEGIKVLCDPWLVDGAYYGSWCHYPPLNINIEDHKQINGISISPKKEFNILKIWFKTKINNLNNVKELIKLYKPYLVKENIKIKKYK